MATNATMIAELTRAKVLFQGRAIAAAMGLPRQPLPSPSIEAEIARLQEQEA